MRVRAHSLITFALIAAVIAFPFLASAQKHFDTQIKQVRGAQMQTIVDGGFFPERQSVVFWHDSEWSIDLVLPADKAGLFSMRIRSPAGQETLVRLPEDAKQIESVVRAPGDKAIVGINCDSESSGFVILDLKKAGIVDKVCSSDLSISPDRRFIVFDSWFTNWDGSVPHEFRLYDVQKTPKENTCGYPLGDTKQEKLDDYLRGLQAFPPIAACSDNDKNRGFDFGTNFTWAPDSSKIVFAIQKGKVMNLVLIRMPLAPHVRPKASIYALKGSQDVCAGETAADGDQNCDYHVIQSLRWEGDSIKGSFHHQFGTRLNFQMTIPASAFVPVN